MLKIPEVQELYFKYRPYFKFEWGKWVLYDQKVKDEDFEYLPAVAYTGDQGIVIGQVLQILGGDAMIVRHNDNHDIHVKGFNTTALVDGHPWAGTVKVITHYSYTTVMGATKKILSVRPIPNQEKEPIARITPPEFINTISAFSGELPKDLNQLRYIINH